MAFTKLGSNKGAFLWATWSVFAGWSAFINYGRRLKKLVAIGFSAPRALLSFFWGIRALLSEPERSNLPLKTPQETAL